MLLVQDCPNQATGHMSRRSSNNSLLQANIGNAADMCIADKPSIKHSKRRPRNESHISTSSPQPQDFARCHEAGQALGLPGNDSLHQVPQAASEYIASRARDAHSVHEEPRMKFARGCKYTRNLSVR